MTHPLFTLLLEILPKKSVDSQKMVGIAKNAKIVGDLELIVSTLTC